MAISLYLDPITKDLTVQDYNLKLTTNDVEFVSQKIETTLRFFKNEWFLNRTLGMPYYTDILVKNPDLKLVTSLFKNAITKIDEIENIIKFEVLLDTATRILTIYFEAQTSDGIASNTLSI